MLPAPRQFGMTVVWVMLEVRYNNGAIEKPNTYNYTTGANDVLSFTLL